MASDQGPRIVALDVHYGENAARVAAVGFADWRDEAPTDTLVVATALPEAEYQPGEFSKRELGPLLTAISQFPAPPEILIIDGFVTLGPERRPGLGWRLWEALGERAAVVGVAKTPFRGAPESTEVVRGASEKPLYVTAVGMEEEEAREAVRQMRGAHRIPALLKLADRLSRGD